MCTEPAGSYLNVRNLPFCKSNLGDQVQTEAKEFQCCILSFKLHEHNSVRMYLDEISVWCLKYSCTIDIIVHVSSAAQGYKHLEY